MEQKRIIMDDKAMSRAIARISYEIVERNKGTEDLVIVGVFSRGVPIGKRIADKLSELDLDELKDLAKDLDISSSDIKKAKKAKALIDLIMDSADEDDILEALGEDSEEEEEEDDDDEDQDYSEMSLSELKAECKNRGLKVKKGMDKEDLIEILEEDDEE